jgi:hypothetical protein
MVQSDVFAEGKSVLSYNVVNVLNKHKYLRACTAKCLENFKPQLVSAVQHFGNPLKKLEIPLEYLRHFEVFLYRHRYYS